MATEKEQTVFAACKENMRIKRALLTIEQRMNKNVRREEGLSIRKGAFLC
jgi:hypothetical protein